MIEEGLTSKITTDTPPNERKTISKARYEYLKDKVTTPSNSPLMLLTEEKELLNLYEVYKHVEQDGTIVYVGEGLMGRSGDASSRRTPTGDHPIWMLDQLFAGNEYIVIIKQFMTKQAAKDLETKLIAEHTPRFNVKKG